MIHPFIVWNHLSFSESQAGWSWHWAAAGDTLDKFSVHYKADIWGQTTIHAPTHTYGQSRVTN